MNYSRYKLRGQAIEATVDACQLYVQGITLGTITAPRIRPRAQHASLRYSPSFITDRKPFKADVEAGHAHPYTANDISRWLGNDEFGHAHIIVCVALGLLEFLERGIISTKDMQTIFDGGPGLRPNDLQTKMTWMRARRGHMRSELLRDHLMSV